jgi:mRNA interferase MazF
VNQVRQGEVYWFDFAPAAAAAPAERHPCVVVQNDVFNPSATSIVCLTTPNLSRAAAPRNVLLKKGEAQLPKPSVVVDISQVPVVDKADIMEYIGKLSNAAAASVRDGLHLLFERL